MNTLEALTKAINARKSISFTYNKQGNLSHRIANPYVVYIFTSKTTGEQSTKVDVVQTGGETDSPDKPFPSFRGFLPVEDILNVKILEDQSFGVPFHPDYNPDSDRYQNPIAKI